MKKLGDSHYAKSIRGKVFRSCRLLQICTAVIMFAGSAGLHSASAQQIDPSSVSDDLACKSEAEKGLSDVDKSIEEKSKNGFDPEKLAKIKAKRQELYDRNFRSCIEIKSANRLSAKADADIAKADADIAESKRRQAKADADIAKADADIAESKRRQAKADADIAESKRKGAEADEMIARVERVKNAKEKLDKTRIQVEAIVNDMQKGPVGMERMNSLLYDLGPKFLAEAKVYLRELKPIIPEDQFRVMESKLKVIESHLPASIQR